jgi:glutamate--cysteine ligase regulatory subunit
MAQSLIPPLYSNIMSSGGALIRRPIFSKSNIELINSLHSNFSSSQDPPSTSPTPSDSKLPSWTTTENDTLYIPTHTPTPLLEPRPSYDITAKLFFLPSIPSSRRCKHTLEAISLVLRELNVPSIDLLIVSYPGVSFDADDSGSEVSDDETSAHSDESTSLDAQVKTWRVLERLHEEGTIKQIGVAEFSSTRLETFLSQVKVPPSVDQINVRDCCVVPKPLIMYAKEHNIELLTHSDCSDILPPGTTRELLGPTGAGIIAAKPDADEGEPGLKGDIEPQWVIKYTAVVRDRGVIENKGYFAVAQLGTCIDDSDKAPANGTAAC